MTAALRRMAITVTMIWVLTPAAGRLPEAGDVKGLPRTIMQDLTRFHPQARGYLAGMAVGKDLYLVGGQQSNHAPGYHGIQARYDPQVGSITERRAWAFFDTMRLSPAASGFDGACSDGRYIYYIPAYGCRTPDCKSASFHGYVARYDTGRPFSEESAWSGFDLQTVDPSLVGFAGAVFDGRYVYFVPTCDNSYSFDCPTHGRLVRYDTHAAFEKASSYAFFDLRNVHSRAHGFSGGIFDGRYVYLIPGYNIIGPTPTYATGTVLVRFDTSGPLDARSSYAALDLSGLHPQAGGYSGGVVAGRYVYLVPNALLVGGRSPRQRKSGLVARYDSGLAFDDPNAWRFFDAHRLAPAAVGFAGAAYDGRHIYFGSRGTRWEMTALVARYDTARPLTTSDAWTVWDWTSNTAVRGSRGVVYLDGSLFFVPSNPAGEVYSGVLLEIPRVAEGS